MANLVTDYYNELVSRRFNEILAEEMKNHPDYYPEEEQSLREALYVTENSDALFDKVMGEYQELKGVDATKLNEIGKKSNPKYQPLSMSEEVARSAASMQTQVAIMTYLTRKAIAEKAVKYVGKLDRVEIALLDISGTEESFERNRDMIEKLHGTTKERTEALAQRLGEIANSELPEVDISTLENVPQNINLLAPYMVYSPDLINAVENMNQLHFDYGDRQTYEAVAKKLNYLGTVGYLMKTQSDIVASPLYGQARIEDFEIDSAGFIKIPNSSEESMEFNTLMDTGHNILPGTAFDAMSVINFMKTVDKGMEILMEPGKSPAEREKKYNDTFNLTETEYNKFAPKEVVEQEVNHTEQSEVEEKAQELTFMNQDGSVDLAKENRKILEKNIQVIQKVIPDFTMSEEEISAMVTPERIAIHEKAAAFLNEKKSLNIKDYKDGHLFPGQSTRIGDFLLDTSGTPGAKAWNEKVFRAFDPARENMNDKIDVLTEVYERVGKLDMAKLSPPTDVSERVDYAIEHYNDCMIAFGIQSAIGGSAMSSIGVEYSEDQAEKMQMLRERAEVVGGLGKSIIELAASNEFLTLPFENMTFEQVSKVQLDDGGAGQEIEGNGIATATYLQGFVNTPPAIDAKIGKTVFDTPFKEISTAYREVNLFNISDVRKEMDYQMRVITAAGEMNNEKSEQYKSLLTQMNELSETFRELDQSKVLDKAAEKKLTEKIEPLTRSVVKLGKSIEEDPKKRELAGALKGMRELTSDFGYSARQIESRFASINRLHLQEKKQQELLSNIEKATLIGSNYGNGNTNEMNELAADCLEWNLNPVDHNGQKNYERMHDFVEAIADWRVKNVLELGSEVKKIQDATGMKDFEAAYVAFEYSSAGKKLFGMDMALSMPGLDDKDFVAMCNQFDIKTELGSLNSYLKMRTAEKLDALEASADEKQKELLNLGKIAGSRPTQNDLKYQAEKELKKQDPNFKGELAWIPKEHGGIHGFVDNYAKEQQEINAKAMPDSINMPSFQGFKTHLADASKTGKELLGIDSKLHRNSKEFNELKKAIQDMSAISDSLQGKSVLACVPQEERDRAGEAAKKVADCAEKYLSDKWNDRKTDLGRKRFDKVVELLQKIDPERAKTLEENLNIRRSLLGMEPEVFDKAKTVDTRCSVTKPEIKEWYASGQKEIEKVVSIYRNKLAFMNQHPESFNKDTMRECMAGIMLGTTIDASLMDRIGTQEKFIKTARETAQMKEFKAITEKIGQKDLNATAEKSFGAKLMKELATEKKKAAPVNSETRQRSNAISGPNRSGGLTK